MKCIIIYFSQTDNTKMIAQAIQAGVKEKAGHCDLVKIKDANPKNLREYDLIGLGCPVFHFKAPLNVKGFINNMRFVGGKHAFVFCTHGTQPAYFFPSTIPMMKRRGLIVIGMRDWYADCLLPSMPMPYGTSGHPDKIDLKEAEAFGREMAVNSSRISDGETGLIPPPPPKPQLNFTGFVKQLARSGIINRDIEHGGKNIKYHKEKCIYPECHLCMDNCPMDGIDLTVEPPVIAKPCNFCRFCTRICPTGAIECEAYDTAIAPIAAKVQKEVMLPLLEKAEAEGSFRRLVPIEKVGLDTPVFKSHYKKPQWIIGKGLQ